MEKTQNYKFFSHTKCEFFPCHSVTDTAEFNCLFCYCPLYRLDCGGNFVTLDNGIKDCSNCLIPHSNYDYVVEKICEHNLIK